MFISPRYKLLPPLAFTTYLQLSTSLINGIPLSVFKPAVTKGKKSNKAPVYKEPDSDSDLETKVSVVSEFVAVARPILPLVIDDKTTKRLQNIIATPHLASLISVTQSKPSLFPHVISYLFALTATWSSSHDEILNAVLASTSGGLVRELYRDLVRRSPLGEEANSGNLFGTSNHLSSNLNTADYVSRLRKRVALAACPAPRRPLLPSTSYNGRRRIFWLLFLLHLQQSRRAQPAHAWRVGVVQQAAAQYCIYNVLARWSVDHARGVRFVPGEVFMGGGKREGDKVFVGYPCERVSSVHLFSIQFRPLMVGSSSRKPFVPADHWLVTSQLDMNSFVEAAVYVPSL